MIDLFDAIPSRANFLTDTAFSYGAWD